MVKYPSCLRNGGNAEVESEKTSSEVKKELDKLKTTCYSGSGKINELSERAAKSCVERRKNFEKVEKVLDKSRTTW